MTKKLKLKISSRLLKKRSKRFSGSQKKHCRFCGGPEQEATLDYKNTNLLRNFLTERGKILPSRISGNCAYHQRSLSSAIKMSRTMALLPYGATRY
jgi:small subunit ribosomal protein S18